MTSSSHLLLPSPFASLLDDLTAASLRANPSDYLQFCADFFNQRLATERALALSTADTLTHHPSHHQHHPATASAAQQLASSAPAPAQAPTKHPGSTSLLGATTSSPPPHLQQQPHPSVAMTSTFPGTTSPFQSGTAGMHSVQEEDENDPIGSPTSANFARNAMSSGAPPAAPSNTFGNFGGFGESVESGEPKNLPNNYNLNRRTSVSAESLAPASSDENWKPPFVEKSGDQRERLQSAVKSNFLFSHLDDDQASLVLGALQEKPIPAKGIKVIQQGDTGDFFYIVERGNFDIFVNKTGRLEAGPDGIGEKVASCGPGNSFGELALMYNAPRAATVISTESSMLWALDRVTFRRILMDSAFQRRRMYESFLEEVPLLASLKPYERSKIADALETQKYSAGQTIIKEGDPGESFFILESGEADVFKESEGNAVLKTYTKGDYFGELALLNDAPRAASVVAKGEVKVATLGKDGFQRLLGPVESIMRRNDPSRQQIEERFYDAVEEIAEH